MPAVSSTTITYPVIQDGGGGGSTSSRPGERAEGALTAVVWWRRRADLFNGNWFVDAATVDHSLTFRLTSVHVYGGTKSRSLVRSEYLRASKVQPRRPKSHANNDKAMVSSRGLVK